MALTEAQVETRARWVEALRSGQYRQGYGMLNQYGRLCCIGVLCEVLGLQTKTLTDGTVAYAHNYASPPTVACRAVGMPETVYDGGFSASDYMEANDIDRLSFDEIADLIVIDTLERTA